MDTESGRGSDVVEHLWPFQASAANKMTDLNRQENVSLQIARGRRLTNAAGRIAVSGSEAELLTRRRTHRNRWCLGRCDGRTHALSMRLGFSLRQMIQCHWACYRSRPRCQNVTMRREEYGAAMESAVRYIGLRLTNLFLIS